MVGLLLDNMTNIQGITMIVVNRVKPGYQEEYRRWVEPVLDAMRHEPSFMNTILHQAADDVCCFMLYETWRDRDEFFNVQMKKSYRSEYERVLPSLLSVAREIRYFTPLRADFTFMHTK